MHFTTDRLKRLQRSLTVALNQEWPQLSATQKRLARLRPTPIAIRAAPPSRLSVVATVATDGGENKLSLEPMQLQVVRVADSLGEIYFEDFVAQSLTPEEILRFFFQSNELLQRFIKYLELDWSQLLPRLDFQRSQLLSMLRELMECGAPKTRQPAAGQAADPRRPAAERPADGCGLSAAAREVREADHQARPSAGRGCQAVAGAELPVSGSGVERELQQRRPCLSARAR